MPQPATRRQLDPVPDWIIRAAGPTTPEEWADAQAVTKTLSPITTSEEDRLRLIFRQRKAAC